MTEKRAFTSPQELFSNTTSTELRELIAAGHSGADLTQVRLIQNAQIELRRREWWRDFATRQA